MSTKQNDEWEESQREMAEIRRAEAIKTYSAMHQMEPERTKEEVRMDELKEIELNTPEPLDNNDYS